MVATSEVPDVKRYVIIGDVDLERIRKVHNLVWECREQLLSNKAMQNLLLNRGYDIDSDPERQRPTSYLDLFDATKRRNIVVFSISHLQRMIDIATKPPIISLKTPRIATLDDVGKIEVVAGQGFSAAKVEQLQRNWLTRHDERELVRRYEKILGKALDEYNLKYTLFQLHGAMKPFIHDYQGEEKALQERICEAFGELRQGTRNVRGILDDAYYIAGNMHFSAAGRFWEQLNKSEFGRMFILTPEEASKAAWLNF